MTNETRTTEEAYCSATTADNLRVAVDTQGDADILIAAGWSKSRLGAALMRLRSEWDAASRRGVHAPRKPTRAAVAAMAAELNMTRDVKLGPEQLAAARAELDRRYVLELKETMRQLKTLPSVRLNVSIKVAIEGAQDSELLCAQILMHWLSPVCQACHGVKFQLAPGGTSLSERGCRTCGATGQATPPGGELGKRMSLYLDDCVSLARSSIRARLRPEIAS